MALRFMDSFDHYASSDVTEKWTGQGSINGAVSSGNGRRGTASWRFTSAAAAATLFKTFDSQATWIIGFAFRAAGMTPSTATAILRLYDAGSVQVDLRINPDATLSVTRAGTALTGGTSVNALSANTYYYIEFKVTIANSIGANTCQVKVDGVTWITVATGQDTQATANATANQIQIALSAIATGISNGDFDDLYICDGAGGANNDFLGDCRVDSLLPNADGSNSQFSPSSGSDHYAMVDDGSPDDNSTYLSDGTSGHRDSWNFQNLSALVSPSIKGVQLALSGEKTDAGTIGLKPLVKSGATTDTKSADYMQSTYRYALALWETDPNTGAAWTEAGVNAAEFGAEVV